MMEEEAEDRDSNEDLVSSGHGKLRRSKRDRSNRIMQDYVDNSSDEKDLTSQKLKAMENEVIHLNALVNLDPNAKFGENASLIKDIRLAASVAAEEEANKAYMCHLCDFKTAYANSLMNHQAVHSDCRPWACTACEYAAKRKQDLKKHLHTVHGMMVESPMLKPVGTSLSPTGSTKAYGGDEMKEHFGEALNLKRLSSVEKDFSVLQPSSSSQGFSPSAKRVKEEASANLNSQTSDKSFDRRNNSIQGRELDSPDDNLPISFSTPSSSSSAKRYDIPRTLESPKSFPKFLPGREEGEVILNNAHPNFAWHFNRRDTNLTNANNKFSDSSLSTNHHSIPRDWSSHIVKREYDTNSNFHPNVFASKIATSHHRHHQQHPAPINDKFQSMSRRERENSLQHSFSLSDDDTHNSSDDRCANDNSITSSSLVGQKVCSTQTPSGFLCEHCDILFYQRAMYVMHIGLHAPDNPWCCAVCGNTFTEKYSFTSHFINQH